MPYDPAALALFARFTTPPGETRKNVINTLIVSLKASGVWAKLDALYMLAAADAQAAQRNWIADQYNLTPSSSPTFTADRGYQGNGTTSNLTATLGTLTNFTLNSAAFGIGVQAHVATAGAANILLGNARTQVNAGITTFQSRVNDATSNQTQGVPGPARLTSIRTGASARQFFKNGVSTGTDTVAATTLGTASVFLLSAGAAAYSGDRLSFAFFGALSAAQVTSADAAILAYLTAVGAA